MKADKNIKVSNDIMLYINLINYKLESVMPEVNHQVKVYEEKVKAGKLNTLPKNFPLFSE